MTDLVERLMHRQMVIQELDCLEWVPDALCREAAAKITRLTSLLEKAEAKNAVAEKLAGALEPFAQYADPHRRAPEELCITGGSRFAKDQLKMSHCYKAIAALTAYKEMTDGE